MPAVAVPAITSASGYDLRIDEARLAAIRPRASGYEITTRLSQYTGARSPDAQVNHCAGSGRTSTAPIETRSLATSRGFIARAPPTAARRLPRADSPRAPSRRADRTGDSG